MEQNTIQWLLSIKLFEVSGYDVDIMMIGICLAVICFAWMLIDHYIVAKIFRRGD